MADCYPILARAISRLTTNNAQTRQKLYEHARKIFAAQLHIQEISATEAIREQIAFESAILKLEAKAQSIPEREFGTFADYAQLHDANNPPDFASLLREPVEAPTEPTAVWPAASIISPAPDILLIPTLIGTR